jgi:hypothetical protein
VTACRIEVGAQKTYLSASRLAGSPPSRAVKAGSAHAARGGPLRGVLRQMKFCKWSLLDLRFRP